MIELTEVLKGLKNNNKNKELFDTLEKRRDSENNKFKIQVICDYSIIL